MTLRERLSPKRITGGAPVLPLALLFGLNAADELDRTAFGILLPEIRDHFGLNNEGILSVITVVGVLAIIGQVLVGYYADRFSRVRIALIGASVWALFTLGTGLAPAIWTLVMARSLTSTGRAVNDPTHRSLLADFYPPDVRPNVYGAHYGANSLGQFLGPVLGGGIAFAFASWRAPFLVFWIPTLVLVLLGAWWLRDPVRGEHERRIMGASEDTVMTEEEPPSLAEAWRICYQVKTLRRVWYSLPFFAVAVVGILSIFSIYYDEVFHLNELERGVLGALTEPFQLVGLLVFIPLATRLAQRDAGLVLKLAAATGSVVAAGIVGVGFAPTLPVAVLAHIVVVVFLVVLIPSILAVLSLAIPPRARSIGFSIGALYTIPGFILLTIVGGVADDYGARIGVMVLAPVFLVGAYVIATAGRYVAADVHKVRTSTVAQAEVLAARRRGEVKLLLVKDLDVSYGPVQVLFGIDFEVDEGEIVALLGTNGAGKSTLLRAISGLVEPGAGAIIFDGRDTTYSTPHEITARGVVQVPGGRGVFPGLTVAENLRIAGWLYQRDAAYLERATEEVLTFFPVLRDRWEQQAGTLSGGEQQMLTLAQAFVAKPRLLMIDELSLGLAPVIVEQLLGIVKAIRDRGTTIILVEQSVNVALTVAQTAYFMEKGEIRFHGPTRELLERPDILRSVFLEGASSIVSDGNGARARERAVRVAPTGGPASRPDETILRVSGLSRSFGGVRAVDDVSFDLAPGQILGVIGPNGAGKTTLFDLVSGFLPPDGGRITFEGRDITSLGAEARARLGLGRSFQDARLFPALTVSETIALALERSIDVRDPVAAALHLPAAKDAERAIAERVDELIEMMGVGAFRDKFIAELSTGSRRIVDLACVLAHEPKVLLFDEPSSGIAQREAEALGPLLVRIRDATGASLLVIEHDMPLVTSIADDMLALDLGRVVTRGSPDEVVNHPHVVASYLGSTDEVIARSGAVDDREARRKKRSRSDAKTRTRGTKSTETNGKRKTSARKTTARKTTARNTTTKGSRSVDRMKDGKAAGRAASKDGRSRPARRRNGSDED